MSYLTSPDGPSHPAPFSASIMDVLADVIGKWAGPVLDPYAGIGRIHELGRDDTFGIEIEEPWAMLHPRTFHADSSTAYLDSTDGTSFCVVPRGSYQRTLYCPRPKALCFSPDYGNRFADQYLGTPEEQLLRLEQGIVPRRRSYAISLNRSVSEGSTCRYKFGPIYRQLHSRIMGAITGICLTNAKAALNVSDFFETRPGDPGPTRVHVVAFWIEMMASLGWVVERLIPVETPRFRDGANSDLRVDAEMIVVMHLQGAQ